MADSEYINARGGAAEAYAIVYAYAAQAFELSSPDAQAFFAALRSRCGPAVMMSGGSGPGRVDPRHPMAILRFTIDQIPRPLEDVLEWLREQPLVRVLEVDRFRDRDTVT